MAKLTFLGAAGTVTGSKYLVEAAGKKLLLDCGIFQGSAELSARNFKPLSADPTRIVLTPRQEIVVALGTAPKKVPSTYSFPQGL